MSNHDNHRRDEKKRTEHGSTWEGGRPTRSPSKARAKYRTIGRRQERRTGKTRGIFKFKGSGKRAPRIDDPENFNESE